MLTFLLGYGRNTCSDKANAPSPTSTNGMDNPSASLGRTLGSGLFSLLLSSNFPNIEFLKHIRVTRRTAGSNLYWHETVVCVCHSHEDHRGKVLVIEKLGSTLIWLPYPNVLSINSSYAVQKICPLVEFICCAYPVILVSSWHIGRFQTFPYRITGNSAISHTVAAPIVYS